jgi:hypothetical protein
MSRIRLKLVRQLYADAKTMAKPFGVRVCITNGGRHQHLRLEYRESYRVVPIGSGDQPEHIRDNMSKRIRRLIIELTAA